MRLTLRATYAEITALDHRGQRCPATQNQWATAYVVLTSAICRSKINGVAKSSSPLSLLLLRGRLAAGSSDRASALIGAVFWYPATLRCRSSAIFRGWYADCTHQAARRDSREPSCGE